MKDALDASMLGFNFDFQRCSENQVGFIISYHQCSRASLVGRGDGASEGDGELGGDERALLVVRDERVEGVEEDLVDEVESDGAVVVLPRLDGDVPHLAPPQERQAVVSDEGLQCRKERDGGMGSTICDMDDAK